MSKFLKVIKYNNSNVEKVIIYIKTKDIKYILDLEGKKYNLLNASVKHKYAIFVKDYNNPVFTDADIFRTKKEKINRYEILDI